MLGLVGIEGLVDKATLVHAVKALAETVDHIIFIKVIGHFLLIGA